MWTFSFLRSLASAHGEGKGDKASLTGANDMREWLLAGWHFLKIFTDRRPQNEAD